MERDALLSQLRQLLSIVEILTCNHPREGEQVRLAWTSLCQTEPSRTLRANVDLLTVRQGLVHSYFTLFSIVIDPKLELFKL